MFVYLIQIELSVPKRNRYNTITAYMRISNQFVFFKLNKASFTLDVSRNNMAVSLTNNIIKKIVKLDEKMINYGHICIQNLFLEK